MVDSLTLQIGGRNSDVLMAAPEEDSILVGRGGRDILIGQAGDDLLKGNKGADMLYGGFGNDMLIGGSGTDFLSGGMGSDILSGGTGSDIFVVDIPLFFGFWEPVDLGGDVEVLEGPPILAGPGFGEIVDGPGWMPGFGPDFGSDTIVDFTGEDQIQFNLPEGAFGFEIFEFLEFVQDGDDVVILFNPFGEIDEGDRDLGEDIDALGLEVIEEEPAGPPIDDGLPSDYEGPVAYELVRLLDTDLETLFSTEPLFGEGGFGIPISDPGDILVS